MREKLLRSVMYRPNAAKLTVKEKEFVDLWMKHRDRATHQREMMQHDIAALEEHEAVIIVDFKENLKGPVSKEATGRDFFDQAPITVLSFVCYLGRGKGLKAKCVVTVLSLCLSHTASFVIHSLKAVLAFPMFGQVQSLKWWSDGGPHFRNQQLLAAFTHSEEILGRKLNWEINFLEARHGKNECDGVFGYYTNLLKHNMPLQGIASFQELLQFFRTATSVPTRRVARLHPPHHFLEFDSSNFHSLPPAPSPSLDRFPPRSLFLTLYRLKVDSFPEKVKFVKIDGFHKFLSFTMEDGMIAARERTDDGTIRRTLFSSTLREKATTCKLKTSSFRPEECDTFERELDAEISQLKLNFRV
jgi:hypothetical protein